MRRPNYYILKDGNPFPITDVVEWGLWYENADRHIAQNNFDGVEISTVFLALDHGWNGPPILYETMIFGGKHDQYQERYETVEQALRGHMVCCKMLEKEIRGDGE